MTVTGSWRCLGAGDKSLELGSELNALRTIRWRTYLELLARNDVLELLAQLFANVVRIVLVQDEGKRVNLPGTREFASK